MVSKKLSPIQQIERHIINKDNFVLTGGAGSGKTYSLIEVLNLLYSRNSNSKIACITFTNVAANEIQERVEQKNNIFKASTIHDFLWDIIKNYQKNIKQALQNLIISEDIKYKGEEELNIDWFKNKTIKYREWKNLEEGIISHNEVLKLANTLFKGQPLLRKILSDKYDYILIDEYQDTEEQVIEIFLDLMQQDNLPITIGLFGDSMQSIYNKGIGSLQNYIESGIVKEVIKEDNWRCSENVISLINKVRNDGIKQNPAGKNSVGSITFLYGNKDDINLNEIKENKAFSKFKFIDEPNENKELYLTHKLIAKQFGFFELLNNYKYTDNLIGDNPDKLAKHLLSIQEIISLYKSKNYNEFIKITHFKLKIASDKQLLKNRIDELIENSNETIENVMNLADEYGLIKKDDKVNNFIINNNEQYEKIKNIEYVEVINLFNYLNEFSPYSTQHGVKGAEFNNVFVVLDNGRWNQYNFGYLFEERDDKISVVERTRKIFYVCCSRAKENLVVYYHRPSQAVINKAFEWFGEENVINIDN